MHHSLLLTTKHPDAQILQLSGLAQWATHPDVLVFNTSESPLDMDLARTIPAFLSQSPLKHTVKWVIILNFESVSDTIQNTLLKMVEEPPMYVRFLLCTQFPQLVLPTIRSRCQVVKDETITREDEPPLRISLFQLSITERSQSIEAIKTQAAALEFVLQEIGLLKQQLEIRPNLTQVSQIRSLHHALTMLHANVNIKLCLEWCFLS